jgi:hypothetical protein
MELKDLEWMLIGFGSKHTTCVLSIHAPPSMQGNRWSKGLFKFQKKLRFRRLTTATTRAQLSLCQGLNASPAIAPVLFLS